MSYFQHICILHMLCFPPFISGFGCGEVCSLEKTLLADPKIVEFLEGRWWRAFEQSFERWDTCPHSVSTMYPQCIHNVFASVPLCPHSVSSPILILPQEVNLTGSRFRLLYNCGPALLLLYLPCQPASLRLVRRCFLHIMNCRDHTSVANFIDMMTSARIENYMR